MGQKREDSCRTQKVIPQSLSQSFDLAVNERCRTKLTSVASSSAPLSHFMRSSEHIERCIYRCLPFVQDFLAIPGCKGDKSEVIKKCDALFCRAFKCDEAEDVYTTNKRRIDMDILYGNSLHLDDLAQLAPLRARYRNSRFYHLAATDIQGDVLGQCLFTVVPVARTYVAVYSQYVNVASLEDIQVLYGRAGINMRSRGLFSLFQGMQLSLALRHGRSLSRSCLLGAFFESEMKGQGDTFKAIRYTVERLTIHEACGSKVMMLRMPDGSLQTPHCQPRLGPNQNRVMLHFLVNFSKDFDEQSRDKKTRLYDAHALVDAYFDNFLFEGFDAKEVSTVRAWSEKRFLHACGVEYIKVKDLGTIVDLSLTDDDLLLQVIRDYGDFQGHRDLIERAFTS